MAARNPLAIITGATGGLGRAFAHHFANEKFKLLLICRDTGKLNEFADTLRNQYDANVDILVADFTDAAMVASAAEQIKTIKRIDYFISCAGYSEHSRFYRKPVESVLKMIDVHVYAAVRLIHAVLPAMMKRKSGNIITISSLAAFIPAPGSSIYSATKAFLNSFMESLHMEVHEYGIRVQSLCPGLTHTDFHKNVPNTIDIPVLDVWMNAEEVVAYSLRDLEDGNVISVPGFINKTIKKAIPAFPRKLYYKLAEKMTEEK